MDSADLRPIGDDPSLLIVDDDTAFRTRLGRAMEKRGFVPTLAESVAEGVSAIKGTPPAYAVIDLRLEDGNGLDVVEALRRVRSDARIIILTGYGAIATAVAAVKAGAVDYLSKPADADDIEKRAARAPATETPAAGEPDVGGPGALGTHPARLRTLRPQRLRDGAAAEHAPPDPAADFGEAQPALGVSAR